MFRFGAKKNAAPERPARMAGLDANATRARAVTLGEDRLQQLPLEEPLEELAFAANMEHRTASIGHAAVAQCRRVPHAICSGYLGLIGQSKEWRAGRTIHTPETLTQLGFDKLSSSLGAESTSLGLALPGYLSGKQVRSILGFASLARLPVSGSVAAPLAVVAHRAGNVGSGGTVLLFDVDDYAMSASLVVVLPNEIRMVGSACWPHASLKLWKDRLIDGIADRCVRVCRRDPRDSAEAEQIIYDQLDAALESTRNGQRITMGLRCEHWYQDLIQTPDDFERSCLPLLRIAVEGLKDLLLSQALPMPPRAIWFSHTAGRLPGLAAKIYRHSPEQTAVSILPANAAAEAVVSLVPRFLEGRLPRTHLEVALPWQRIVSAVPAEAPKPVRSLPSRHPLLSEPEA